MTDIQISDNNINISVVKGKESRDSVGWKEGGWIYRWMHGGMVDGWKHEELISHEAANSKVRMSIFKSCQSILSCKHLCKDSEFRNGNI